LALSFADWLRVAEPHLRPPLFEPEALAHLLPFAERLPGDALGILEVRLAGENPALDLSLRLENAAQARAVAREAHAPHVRRFLERFAGRDGEAADSPWRRLPAAWAEFDQLPDLTFRPDPVLIARLPSDPDLRWVIGTLLPALRGRPLRPAQQRAVERCCDAIPEGAGLLYLFDLGARGQEAVRLELYGLGADRIPAYLERIAPPDVRDTEDLLPLFCDVDRVHLSFDVDDEVLPRIGIEGSFRHNPRREPRWGELLGRSPRAAAALAWTGQDSLWTAPAAWPVRWAGGGGRLARGMSHFKVAVEPGGLDRKAYLSLVELGRSPTH
jgi:hypothetical protein